MVHINPVQGWFGVLVMDFKDKHASHRARDENRLAVFVNNAEWFYRAEEQESQWVG